MAAAFVEATLAADDAVAAEDGFREGDAVEADFRGRGRYYAGKITSVREDGYDVLYDDGDARGFRERRRPESVRRRSEEPEAARPETGEPVFRVGDAVWAKTYYPGAIEKVHEDATYDILYEDGEREARVAEALISKTQAANCMILLAIANDDAEAVAKLATNELKAGKLTFDRCPEPIWGMAGLGIVCMYGDTPYGLQLGSGQTLLDIAQSNKKQAAAGALLP